MSHYYVLNTRYVLKIAEDWDENDVRVKRTELFSLYKKNDNYVSM